MDLQKIASKIVLAYGHYSYDDLKKYLKDHPKADKTKHWIEGERGEQRSPKKEEKVPKNHLNFFNIPESVSGKEVEGVAPTFNIANSAFMTREDDKVSFYIKGVKVENPDHIKKLTERAQAAVMLNTKKYTNIRINTEDLESGGNPDVLAIATNPEWKPQRKTHKYQRDDQPCVMVRSPEKMKKAKLKVMVTNSEFVNKIPILHARIQKGLDKGEPVAAVLYMMTEFGVRPGTFGTKNYGALTMHRKYVHDMGDKIVVKNMPMKHDNRLNCEITDPRVLKIFRDCMKAGDELDAGDKRKNFVFLPKVTSKQFDDTFNETVGKEFNPKNIRTYIATKTAKDMMDEFFFNNGIGEKMSLANRYELMKKICKVVSKLIHNQPSMSFESYVDHSVLEPLGIDLVWSEGNPYLKAKKEEKKQKLVFKKDLEKQKKLKLLWKKYLEKIDLLKKRMKEKKSPSLASLKETEAHFLKLENSNRAKLGLPETTKLGLEYSKKLFDTYSLSV